MSLGHLARARGVIPQPARRGSNVFLREALLGKLRADGGSRVSAPREIVGAEPRAREVIHQSPGTAGGENPPGRAGGGPEARQVRPDLMAGPNASAGVADRASQEALAITPWL